MNMTTRPDIRFYDTSSLLIAGERLFEREDTFLVSSITFSELERIKTSNNKDPDIKYAARHLLHLFDSYPEKYTLVIHTLNNEGWIKANELDITDDTRILSDAIAYDKKYRPDETIFVTNDLSLKYIANLYFGQDMIESIHEDEDDYVGYKIIEASDEELANLYQDTTKNWYNLLTGEYLIIVDHDENVIDTRCWTGSDHRYLKYGDFKSKWFGKIKPYDIYQKLLFDSLSNNKLTLARGPAGSGKSLISLAYLVSEMERGNLDKIVIFCNTVATANSARLGFYPGSRLEKLLDSQIGNFLKGKFGGMDGVQRLIDGNQLDILPMSDIRGFEANGHIGVYITEAQNLDRELIKLALQRAGEDCVFVVEGDNTTQVDMKAYEGDNNGMRAMSKAFRGEDIYGEIKLQEVYRSRIAQIAERIK